MYVVHYLVELLMEVNLKSYKYMSRFDGEKYWLHQLSS
jgi:hypothetical protein